MGTQESHMLFMVGIIALLVVPDPGPAATPGPPEPTSRSVKPKERETQPWVREGRKLLAQLRALEKEAKPHLWAWRVEIEPDRFRHWTAERKAAWLKSTKTLNKLGGRVYDLTWNLWRVTGHHPFKAIGTPADDDSFLEYLPRLIGEYDSAIEKRKHLSESEMQYRGLLGAAGLLTGKCWRPSVLYLEDRIHFRKAMGSQHPFHCPGRLPHTLGEKMKAAYSSWIRRNLSPKHWDADSKRFCSAEGGKFDNRALRQLWYERLFAPKAPTTTQATSRPRPTDDGESGHGIGGIGVRWDWGQPLKYQITLSVPVGVSYPGDRGRGWGSTGIGVSP